MHQLPSRTSPRTLLLASTTSLHPGQAAPCVASCSGSTALRSPSRCEWSLMARMRPMGSPPLKAEDGRRAQRPRWATGSLRAGRSEGLARLRPAPGLRTNLGSPSGRDKSKGDGPAVVDRQVRHDPSLAAAGAARAALVDWSSTPCPDQVSGHRDAALRLGQGARCAQQAVALPGVWPRQDRSPWRRTASAPRRLGSTLSQGWMLANVRPFSRLGCRRLRRLQRPEPGADEHPIGTSSLSNCHSGRRQQSLRTG